MRGSDRVQKEGVITGQAELCLTQLTTVNKDCPKKVKDNVHGQVTGQMIFGETTTSALQINNRTTDALELEVLIHKDMVGGGGVNDNDKRKSEKRVIMS